MTGLGTGFVIEALREPRPDAAARRSFFLHLRCRRS
jgi:hypothetical protein